MNLNDLNGVPLQRSTKRRKGRGPGSGAGKTAGRGTKGQKSRSGSSRRMGFEGGQMPLFRRLPKKGFTNALFRVEYEIVNTGALNAFEDGVTVDLELLKSTGLVKKNAARIKILAKGALTRKLTIKADKFSAPARQMVEGVGGSAEEIA
ncbi:MAG: 50S ribosomal protein L15 [Planctomycetes bacterium]|nr:50S ribosomal protein L15 [Planctomycetota bacterium]